LKRTKDNNTVLFAGRYSEEEILAGPELAAKKIFTEYCRGNSSVFIQYFFDGRKYSLFKKLFGREPAEHGGSEVLTLGIFRIIPELLRKKPAIIHLTTFGRFALIFYIYKLLFKVKILYNSHGIIQYENSELKKLPFFYRFKDKFCERIFLKYSDKIIFPSEFAMDMAGKYYDLDESKAAILPNGVSELFFGRKAKPQQPGSLKAVMHFKNEMNRSGLELLERTLHSITARLDIFVLTDATITLPQTEQVTFFISKMMPPEELQIFYEDKDIFLSLNKYDTFSISAAEAMASGLIPVVTIQTGISRYIKNGLTGFVFDHYDITKFALILNTIGQMNLQERNDISSAASETAHELNWSKVYGMYEELYRNTAG